MDDESLTDIQQFYNGTTIFITGGTGFIGNALVAKLLISCPGIKNIYLLVRKEKLVSSENDLEKILHKSITEKVGECRPNYRDTIRLMVGDCTKPDLGLSKDDLRKLQQDVEVIFHVAATIKFNAPLHEAVSLNVMGTEELLKIATDMPKLKVFTHVSTAYVNFSISTGLEEKFYDAPFSPESIINLVKLLDQQTLCVIEPALWGSYPNTYIFTKTLAENICRKYCSKLPLIIFRPAIVLSAYEEPMPGWINTTYGAIGFFIATASGILRTALMNSSLDNNIVPCDYVINGMLAAASASGKRLKNACKVNQIPSDSDNDTSMLVKDTLDPPPEAVVPRIYNFGSTCSKNKFTWGRLIRTLVRESNKIPSNQAIGIAWVIMTQNRFLYRLYAMVLHILPALIIDNATKFIGKPTRLLYYQRKISKMSRSVMTFTTTAWPIRNTNTQFLYESLSDADKRIFCFDLDRLNWDLYVKHVVIGVRRYIFKEESDTLTMAKWRYIGLLILNRMQWFIFAIGFIYAMYLVVIRLPD